MRFLNSSTIMMNFRKKFEGLFIGKKISKNKEILENFLLSKKFKEKKEKKFFSSQKLDQKKNSFSKFQKLQGG